MTTFDLIFVSASVGTLFGLLVAYYDGRKLRRSNAELITELEAWNSTALKAICELEDEKEKLIAEKHEANLMYVSHLDSHVCEYAGKEEEWPEDVSFQ